MAMKIALIAALCISQGLALKPLFRGEKEPCKHPLPESAEIIPHEFEEAMNELDDIRETVSAALMESYFKGVDPQVIIACFEQQRENFARLGQDVANKIRAASLEMATELGVKYEEYARKVAEPLRKIAETLRTLPEKMWDHIKNEDFLKALEVYRESRRIVEDNSRIVARITRQFAAEFPEAVRKAEKMAQEIREHTRRGCQEIGNAFRKCVEEGGPRTPVEDAQ